MKKIIYIFLIFSALKIHGQALNCLTPTLVFSDPTIAGNPVISPTIDCNYSGLIMVRTAPSTSGSPTYGNAPCLRIFTSLTAANAATNNTICVQQGTQTPGCVNPTGNVLYTLYWYGLNPQWPHTYTLCNKFVSANVQYTIASCYDNNIINSGTWVQTSANACQTIGIPANTPIGSASFAISPAVPAQAIAQNSVNGSVMYDPYYMAAGVYTVTYTFSTPSCTTSASRTFQINNPFTTTGTNFNIPPPQCPDGPCINLYSLQTAGSYSPGVWTGLGVSSGSLFCPATTGAGTFAVTYSTGVTAVCSGTTTKTFYVAPQPTANAGATKSLTCINNPTILTGSGGGTYSWSNITLGNNFSSSASPTVGFSGTYSLVVNNGTCSSLPATMQVITNTTPPSLPSVGVSNVINCINTTAVISGTGSNINYQWSGPGIVAGGSTSSPTVNLGGTYNYTITSTVNGCTATSNQAVTQNTATTMNLSTSGAAINCTNNASTISGDQATYSYTWTAPATGTIVSGQSTQNLNIQGTGVYTLSATNPANGCIVTRTIIPTTNTAIITPTISNNPVVTCANGTVTLNGLPGSGVTYTWAGVSVVGPANNQNANINAGGIYTLSVTNSTNGCVGTRTINVGTSLTPPTTPTVSPGSVSLTCSSPNAIITSTATGATSYSWIAPSGGSILSGGNTATAQVTSSSPGLFTVVATGTNGCQSMQTVSVTPNANSPTLTSISVSNSLSCINGTAAINTTGSNLTYTWSGPGIVSGGNSASVTVNIGGTYNYTIYNTVTGCSSTSVQAVIQNTATSMTLNTTGAAINCTNNATSVSGNQPGYTYTWTAPATGTIVSGQSTPTLNILGTGVYTLVATNPANGCTITRTVMPTTNTAIITPTISNNPVITCSNATVTLNGLPGGVTYTWSGVSVVGPVNNQTASIDAGGVYTLAVTNPTNGCVGTRTISIAISTLSPSTPTINPGSVILACPAQTAAVTGTATGATSYSWIPPAGGSILSGGNTATAQVTSSSPGLFTVVATGTNGCQSSQTVQVSPNTNAPTFTLSNPNPSITCASSSPSTTVNITSTVAITSYSWGPSGGISGPTNTASVTFTASGSYTVMITGANGCISTGVVSVGTATTPPSVVAGTGTASPLSCSSPSTIIIPSISPSSPNYTYTWSGPSIVGTPNNSSVQVNGPGTYTLAITDTVTGCSSGSFTVAVSGNNTPPTVNVVASSTVGIGCSASTSTAQLFATSSSSVSYLWSTSATTSVITVNAAGVYTVTITDASTGCSNSATIAVNNSATAPGFSATAVGNFPCGVTNSTLQLSAAASSTNSVSYAWSGGSIISGSNTANPVINQPGLYTVVVTDNVTGCSATSTLAVFSPTVIANFTVDVAAGGAPLAVTFSNSSLGANTYSWTFGDGSTSTSTNPANTFTTPGTYTVTLVSTNGLCSDTHTLEIKVTGGLGIIPQIFTPNGDGKNDPFYIPGLDAYPKNKLQIFNRWGNIVYEAAPYQNDWNGTPNKSSMGTGKLPVGAYFYILDLGDETEPEPIRKGFIQLEY
jgi:gliding motility-associated-like protein